MLIGLSAMLSVGMSIASEVTPVVASKKVVTNVPSKPVITSKMKKEAAVKAAAEQAAQAAQTQLVAEQAATTKMLTEAELAEQKSIIEAGIAAQTPSMFEKAQAGCTAAVASIVSAKDSVVKGVMNPSETASNAWNGTKSFGSYALDSAYNTGNSVYENTFGKDLKYFKHDGAVASTVVVAGLIGGGYLVYKKGYVSKLKKALFGKMAKLTPVAKATPVKLAPRKFIR